IALEAAEASAPYGIWNARYGTAVAPWQLTWALDGEVSFTAWALPEAGESVLIGDGWGERGWGHFNTLDKKVDVPYVVRRRRGDAWASAFGGVCEAPRGQPLVTGLTRLPVGGDAVALAVRTRLGMDVLVAALTSEPRTLTTARGALETDGLLTVSSPGFLYLA